MKKMRIAVFFGGRSHEHDISCLSAQTILRNMDPEKYEAVPIGILRDGRWLLVKDLSSLADGSWRDSAAGCSLLPGGARPELLIEEDGRFSRLPLDAAFPVLHGRFGEDGTIQGLFELARLPYVGCGVAASAVSMDKLLTKALVAGTGIDQARYLGAEREDLRDPGPLMDRIEQTFDYPVFVKPSDGGSSQGVSRVTCREELEPALRLAGEEGTRILIEEAIFGREVECAVMTTPDGPRSGGVGEILASGEFYSFDSKYTDPASLTLTDPLLPEGKREEIAEKAVAIYRAVRAYGLSRVDFFLENGTDRVVFNEINTMPGFTSISMWPMLWKSSGVPVSRQIDALIESALRRFDS